MKVNRYLIVVKHGPLVESYIAVRHGRYFHFDFDGPIGCSTIEYRNSALVKYEKIKG